MPVVADIETIDHKTMNCKRINKNLGEVVIPKDVNNLSYNTNKIGGGKASSFGLKKKLTQRKTKADAEIDDDFEGIQGIYEEDLEIFGEDVEGKIKMHSISMTFTDYYSKV